MSGSFQVMARRAFAFLEKDGFRVVASDASALRYESASAFVAVTWDPRSGELQVYVGLQPGPGEKADAFLLDDLLRMEGVTASDAGISVQVPSSTRLQPFLDTLADHLRLHARPALAGDGMVFRRLDAFRHAQSEAYMRAVKLQQVRTEAASAWRRRDLHDVLRLYSSIEEHLSEAEHAMLAYARRHRAE